jgi:hypothetical protein
MVTPKKNLGAKCRKGFVLFFWGGRRSAKSHHILKKKTYLNNEFQENRGLCRYYFGSFNNTNYIIFRNH